VSCEINLVGSTNILRTYCIEQKKIEWNGTFGMLLHMVKPKHCELLFRSRVDMQRVTTGLQTWLLVLNV
jgi:hypothetical protein